MGRYIQPNPIQQQDAYLKPLRRGVATLNRKMKIAKDTDKYEIAQQRNILLDKIYFERKGKTPNFDAIFDKNLWLCNIRLYNGDRSDLLPLDTATEKMCM